MPTINVTPVKMQNGDTITYYTNTVGTTNETFSFLKQQEKVKLSNRGSKNITYTIGTQTGTLTPSQEITVSEPVSSLVLNAASGTQNFEVYTDEAGSKYEDTNMQLITNLTTLKWKGKKMITFGDSIVAQDGIPYVATGKIARGFQTIIKEKLGFVSDTNMGRSGLPIVNNSANGVEGTNLTVRLVTDFSPYDLVIVAGGTNDFKLNRLMGTKGVIGDTTFDNNTFYGAYRQLVEHIITTKPTIKIVLFTPLQRDNAGYDVNFANTAGFKLVDYVDAIKAVGEMYSVPVCDMYRNSGITKLSLNSLTLDSLHPNDEGYLRMGDYASSFISMI